MVRGEITGSLGRASFVANSVLRVMADAQAALSHLVLRYIDWLSKQFLPDTAESEWLSRHGEIWLTNSDGSVGRKAATLAQGSIVITGVPGAILPSGSQLTGGADVLYETLEQAIVLSDGTEVNVRAITAGTIGNMAAGDHMTLNDSISGVDADPVVIRMDGGVDEETDTELRTRILWRIRQPPMGGDAADYVLWALAVPGVTRAWAAGNQVGPGTVTVRFMMDILRQDFDGFPDPGDVGDVRDYLNTVRPVTVKDFFVEAPIAEPVDVTIINLQPDTSEVRAAIRASLEQMLEEKARPSFSVDGITYPAQTIYAAWLSEAILQAAGVISFKLDTPDHVMPNDGAMGVLGDISYEPVFTRFVKATIPISSGLSANSGI